MLPIEERPSRVGFLESGLVYADTIELFPLIEAQTAMNAHNLVNQTQSLISFPSVAIRVNELLSNDDVSLNDVAATIETDPALTAGLLRLSNSAALGGKQEVTSVAKAITRIGLRQINELVMGIDTARSFNGLKNTLITVHDFWRHSLFCAVIARKLANLSKIQRRDAAFTAGLLHDIGQLVMFNQLGEQCAECLSQSIDDNDGLVVHIIETERLGFNHCDVGRELASKWGLPDALIDCITHHHDPQHAEFDPDLVAAVHIANSLAVMAELDTCDEENAPPMSNSAWQQLGLSRDIVPDLVALAQDEVDELLAVFTDG